MLKFYSFYPFDKKFIEKRKRKRKQNTKKTIWFLFKFIGVDFIRLLTIQEIIIIRKYVFVYILKINFCFCFCRF